MAKNRIYGKHSYIRVRGVTERRIESLGALDMGLNSWLMVVVVRRHG